MTRAALVAAVLTLSGCNIPERYSVESVPAWPGGALTSSNRGNAMTAVLVDHWWGTTYLPCVGLDGPPSNAIPGWCEVTMSAEWLVRGPDGAKRWTY